MRAAPLRNAPHQVVDHKGRGRADRDALTPLMESGVIVERGTHAALLERQGRYAQMWTMQQIEAAPVL